MPFRSPAHGTYVNCGHCPACLSEKANRRSSLISATHPDNTICYFVTLTYSNDFLPYVKIDDLYDAYYLYSQSRLCDDSLGHSPFICPVYRNAFITYGHGSSITHREVKEVGFLVRDDLKISDTDFSNEIGSLMFPISGHSGIDMDGCISVAFHEDKDLFINRLRKRVYQRLGTYKNLKYYYAPEYGPTTARYHLHFLIWCDERISLDEFKFMVQQSWPYMDYKTQRDYCQVAINASSYLSQYVNCSSEISPLLLDIAPLRSSHSLGIGFDNDNFKLENVCVSENEFKFDFTTSYLGKDGNVRTYHSYIPPRVSYRYFPKIKGFSRLSEEKLVSLYTHIFYIPLPKCIIGYRGEEELYQLSVLDVFNLPISVTLKEYRTFRTRLIKSYLFYRKLRPCSLENFFRVIYRFYSKYALFRYYMQFNSPESQGVMEFLNLDDDVQTIFPPDFPNYYSCNNNPLEVQRTKDLADKFNRNIKQRKLNNKIYV